MPAYRPISNKLAPTSLHDRPHSKHLTGANESFAIDLELSLSRLLVLRNSCYLLQLSLSLIAVIYVLCVYDGKPTPQLLHGLTLNTGCFDYSASG